ncbi:hypothetical protein BESB_024980 [Besnoitia besnoiti]|uniref:tRNA-guanine(15) transglycosylase-like domain-containing protein n=1 Tax=Besnoitia besnoiti TaxID=94643 RepID=A0A2A9M815_BESBE|nr:uncharacterized protein BESB_024980 [Besnoitia besnoiti]PFH31532.1 hypothetical protein BESB_024980 [Besnoitia besnoiti]
MVSPSALAEAARRLRAVQPPLWRPLDEFGEGGAQNTAQARCANGDTAPSQAPDEGCLPRLGMLLEAIPTPAFSLSTQRGVPQCLLPLLLRKDLKQLKVLDVAAGEAQLLLPLYQRWWQTARAAAPPSLACPSAESDASSGAAAGSGDRRCARCRGDGEGQSKTETAEACNASSDAGAASRETCDTAQDAVVTCAQGGEQHKRRRLSSGELTAAAPGCAGGPRPAESYSPSSSCPEAPRLPPVCDLAGFALHLMARDLQSPSGNIFPVSQKAAHGSPRRDGDQPDGLAPEGSTQPGGEKKKRKAAPKLSVGTTAGRQTLDAQGLFSVAVAMQAHMVTAPAEEYAEAGGGAKGDGATGAGSEAPVAQNGLAPGSAPVAGGEGEEVQRALCASKKELRMLENAEEMLRETIDEAARQLARRLEDCCSSCGGALQPPLLVHGAVDAAADARLSPPPLVPYILANLQGGGNVGLRRLAAQRLASSLLASAPASWVSGLSVGGLGLSESLGTRRRLFHASLAAPRLARGELIRFLPLHRGGPLELLHALCCGADFIQGGHAQSHAEEGTAYIFDPHWILDAETPAEDSMAERDAATKDSARAAREDAREAQRLLEEAAARGLSNAFLHIDLKSAAYRDDFRPLMAGCGPVGRCPGKGEGAAKAEDAHAETSESRACRWATVSETRAYIHHLFNTAELMGPVLLLQHNLQCLLALFEVFRVFLKRRKLRVAVMRFLERCCQDANATQTEDAQKN